jgi:hypothetical protein
MPAVLRIRIPGAVIQDPGFFGIQDKYSSDSGSRSGVNYAFDFEKGKRK